MSRPSYFLLSRANRRGSDCSPWPSLLHCTAMARQRMGQHFLADSGWQHRVLAALPPHSNDVWVEIGAGHGEMTRFLAAQCRRVIAIEGDPPLAESLRKRVECNPHEWPGVEIVEANVLACDLSG